MLLKIQNNGYCTYLIGLLFIFDIGVLRPVSKIVLLKRTLFVMLVSVNGQELVYCLAHYEKKNVFVYRIVLRTDNSTKSSTLMCVGLKIWLWCIFFRFYFQIGNFSIIYNMNEKCIFGLMYRSSVNRVILGKSLALWANIILVENKN